MENLGWKTSTVFCRAIGSKVVNYMATFLQLNLQFSCSAERSEWDLTLLKPLENPV